MVGTIHIGLRNNPITLLFNWKVGALEEQPLAIMLQAKEGADHKGALKEWKIFQELVPT